MTPETVSSGVHVLACLVSLPIGGYILWLMVGPAIRELWHK